MTAHRLNYSSCAHSRRLVRVLAVVAGAILGVLVPAMLFAHAMLVSSSPASGAHLTIAPRDLRLTFTEPPDLTFTHIELRDAVGTIVAVDSVRYAPDSKRTLIVTVRGALDAGTYTVLWRTAGDDGHPSRGRFSFTIAPGAAGSGIAPLGQPAAGPTAPGQSAPPAAHHATAQMPMADEFDAESPLYVAIRWLQFTGLIVVLGTVAFRLFVLGRMARVRPPRLPLIGSAAALAASTGLVATTAVGAAALLRLGAQSYAVHGASGAWNLLFVSTMLRNTVWGWGWLAQMAGVVIALVGFSTARRESAGRWTGPWTVAALGAVVLAFTPAMSGHAASAAHLTALAMLADGVHVIGAGGWLGSLLLVVTVGIPVAMRLAATERGPAVADLVNAFSPTALAFAALLATTGTFAAWLNVGSFHALWESAYGRTLLIKLALLSVVTITGAYNWLRVRPALGDLEGVRRVRRSASVELAVALFVLAVTAVLVVTPTAVQVAAAASGGVP